MLRIPFLYAFCVNFVAGGTLHNFLAKRMVRLFVHYQALTNEGIAQAKLANHSCLTKIHHQLLTDEGSALAMLAKMSTLVPLPSFSSLMVSAHTGKQHGGILWCNAPESEQCGAETNKSVCIMQTRLDT